MKEATLLSIAKEEGHPVYVYDASKIEQQFTRLQNAFKGIERLRINYACKALSNLSVLGLMKKMGAGLDTVSIQEVQMGIKADFEPKDIIFTPNGVCLEEIERASQLGVQINIDNLSILEQFGTKHPDIPRFINLGMV